MDSGSIGCCISGWSVVSGPRGNLNLVLMEAERVLVPLADHLSFYHVLARVSLWGIPCLIKKKAFVNGEDRYA